MFYVIVNTPLNVSNGKVLLHTGSGNDSIASQIYLSMIKVFYLVVLISALLLNTCKFSFLTVLQLKNHTSLEQLYLIVTNMIIVTDSTIIEGQSFQLLQWLRSEFHIKFQIDNLTNLRNFKQAIDDCAHVAASGCEFNGSTLLLKG